MLGTTGLYNQAGESQECCESASSHSGPLGRTSGHLLTGRQHASIGSQGGRLPASGKRKKREEEEKELDKLLPPNHAKVVSHDNSGDVFTTLTQTIFSS